MTLTSAPKTGHQTFLYSKLATDLDALQADIAFLGIPYGDAYTFAEIVNDQTNMPAAMRRATDRITRSIERYDFDALTSLIHEDATQSMPPYDLWLQGRDDIFAWWAGPGISCSGSRMIPTGNANGSPAFGQYKPNSTGGFDPWALQVLELSAERIIAIDFFLDTARLFPLFGLPSRL